MPLEQRLGRLMPSLTAKERAKLVLRSLKEGTPENPQWRLTMPPSQGRDFNRYIGLMNVANVQLAAYITVMELLAGQTHLRFAWLLSLRQWQRDRETLKALVFYASRQAISQSDYDRECEQAAGEFTPVDDLARVLAADHQWEESDLEYIDKYGVRLVKGEAWERVCRAKATELRSTARERGLVTRGSGSAMQIQNGSFYQALGRPVQAWPAKAEAYEVLPDKREQEVIDRRFYLELLWDQLDHSPFDAWLTQDKQPGEGLQSMIEGLAESVERQLRTRWQELLATEELLDEMGSHLDGEDLLKPVNRQALNHTKELVQELRDDLATLGVMDVDLPEADDLSLQEVRQFASDYLDAFG